MTMANRFLTVIALLGTCLSGTTWAGTVPTGLVDELNGPAGQYWGSNYYVLNDQKNSSDNDSTDEASNSLKDTNKPKRSTSRKNGSEKTKPVKPYVPSETIPADQAVDFPYDI